MPYDREVIGLVRVLEYLPQLGRGFLTRRSSPLRPSNPEMACRGGL